MPDGPKIATLTLHPALDMTVRVDHLRLGEVNRAQAMQVGAGGKGVNVATFLSQSGCRVAASGFLGEENAEVFERHFSQFGIEDRFLRIPGRTRVSVKLVDEGQQATTDINLTGPAPSAQLLDRLFEIVVSLAEECSWIMVSGSLPPGVDPGYYARLIRGLKARGCSVGLDSSGEALRQGIEAGPTLVKPNLRELEELTGGKLDSDDHVLAEARGLVEKGIELVVVSMGDRGAFFVESGRAFLVVPPMVEVVHSTVAAGDALVAGIIVGRMRELDLRETARLATTWAAGKLIFAAARLPDEPELAELGQRVEVREIY
jgi:1-phosphofructokinase